MGHVPRKYYAIAIFFLKDGGNITGHSIYTNYKVSPIPAGGLEVPLLLAANFFH